MTYSVSASLDRYVASINEEKLPDGKNHPSSLHACERQAYYARTGTPQTRPPNEQSLRVFRLGHIVHDLVQTAMEQDPDVVEFIREVEVENPALNLKGHADGVLTLRNGVKEVIEIKSIGEYGFTKKDLPQEDHVDQVTDYMVALRIPRARIVYVSKEKMAVKEFTVFLSDSRAGRTAARVERVERAAGLGVPPPCDFAAPNAKGKRDWHTDYCNWGPKCWERSE